MTSPESTEMVMTTAVLKEKWSETPDTITYGFKLNDGRGPADFKPGQFNMLYVYGAGEVPISVASSKGEGLLKHTIRSVGRVTSVIPKIKVGEPIGLRGPYGSCWPTEKAYGKQLVLIAGGLGLAPLRPVVLDSLRETKMFREIKILYGAKTPQDLLFRPEYIGWRREMGAEFLVTVDKGDERWSGNIGVVTALLNKIDILPDETIAFVCGPEMMMKFSITELLKKHVAEESIYVSLERNMQCGIASCGHCQMGPFFVCEDGPVFSFARVKKFFARGEL